MIEFTCRCGHSFSLEESEAGGLIQCPDCGRLNDVPTLGDLPNLAEDGTYQLGGSDPRPQPDRLPELHRTFTRGTTDELGRDIDLRLTPEQLAMAGTRTGPVPAGIEAVGNRPRYDPETGELVRPLEIKADPEEHVDPATIPLAKATVSYATPSAFRESSPRWTVIQLLMPINLLVMLFVFSVHTVVQLILGGFMGAGIALISPMLLMAQFLIVAHYGNVIDEIGPAGNDELPRFLRDLRFSEDIWGPMMSMLGSVVLCYTPALLCLVAFSAGSDWFLVLVTCIVIVTLLVVFIRLCFTILPMELTDVHWKEDVLIPIGVVIAGLAVAIGPSVFCCLVHASDPSLLATGGTLAIAGTILFPSVVLTLATSGSSVNLRPDRLLETARICGRRYLLVMVVWLVAVPLYVFGLLGISSGAMGIVSGAVKFSAWSRYAAVTMPALMLGIFAMHWFCWELASLYRIHHDSFPWLFQRHQPRNARLVRRAYIPGSPPTAAG